MIISLFIIWLSERPTKVRTTRIRVVYIFVIKYTAHVQNNVLLLF